VPTRWSATSGDPVRVSERPLRGESSPEAGDPPPSIRTKVRPARIKD
jgi:hypothetical protein